MTLTLDSQFISLNDTRLPGVVDSMSVSGKLVLDKKNTEKQSGSTTTVNGWDNATIAISLILLNDPSPTAEEKLKRVVNAFHAIEAATKAPPLYTLSGPLATAWRITQVRLQELSSSLDRASDSIKAQLKLVEENTTQRLIEQRIPEPKTAQEKTDEKPQALPVPDSALSVAQQRELKEKIQRIKRWI